MLENETWFQSAGRLKSFVLGMATGAFFGLLALYVSGPLAFVLGLMIFPPLYLWMFVSLFLVIFYSLERERILGHGYSSVGGFFVRLFSPFFLFVFGWVYALVAFAFIHLDSL